MRRRARGLLRMALALGAALPLGCAASSERAAEAGPDRPTTPFAAPRDAQPGAAEPLRAPSDPWSRLPEGEAPPAGGPAPDVRVALGEPSLRLVAQSAPRAVGLAVVVVRGDRWVEDGDVLLALDARLADDPGLSEVAPLRPEAARDARGRAPPAVSLADLARLARARGAGLLLVHRQPDPTAPGRLEGWVVETETGALLEWDALRDGRSEALAEKRSGFADPRAVQATAERVLAAWRSSGGG